MPAPASLSNKEVGEDHREVEIGLAWLARLDGDGPKSSPRVLVQFLF